MNRINVKKLVLAAMFVALGLVLPFLTMQIPSVGSMLLPMHLPVLLCGFVCGGPLGLLVGAVTPLLRSVLFGMPPLFPTAIAMAFELAAYGLLTGLFHRALPKTTGSLYLSLVLSMLGGRVVWGAVMTVLMGLGQTEFGLAAFLSGAFTTAIPGIVLQLVLIPAILYALRKAKYLD